VAKEEQDIGFYAGFVGEQCLLFFTIGISRLISSTEMFIYTLASTYTCCYNYHLTMVYHQRAL
jgi:hypothetical protein